MKARAVCLPIYNLIISDLKSTPRPHGACVLITLLEKLAVLFNLLDATDPQIKSCLCEGLHPRIKKASE